MAQKNRTDDELINVKNANDISKLNSIFNGLVNQVKTLGLSSSLSNDEELSNMQRDLDDALNYEVDILSRYTSDKEMTTMLNKVLKIQDNTNPAFLNKSINDVLEDDVGQYGVFFYDRYKNINNQYEDLRIITEYLYEMEEVVNTVRDNLVCADDLGTTISRQFEFAAEADKNKTSYLDTVERIEKKYNLKSLLKNTIYKYTLTYGNYYVYTMPYSKLFALYKTKERKMNRLGKTEENTIPNFDSIIKESVVKVSDFFDEKSDISAIRKITESYNEENPTNKLKESKVSQEIKSILENIEIIDSDIPLMEDSEIQSMADPEFLKLINKSKQVLKQNKPSTSNIDHRGKNLDLANDSVIDPSDLKDYDDIQGTYIKLYSPTKVIPVNILDYTIGYYVLYETFGEVQNNLLVNGSMNRLNLVYQQEKRKELDNNIVSLISEKIVKSIDKKFIHDNVKFKELVANAISYDNFYRKAFRIQFVSTEYMTAFKINENPESRMGESILKKSLFYAKLYLSLLIFKIISILTKSNDQRVYYIKNSGISKNMINRVQEAARAMKRNQINFNDLACVNTILSKVGKNPDMYIPVGRGGEKSIEFDILSGQDIQLDTPLMEFLRKNMINNTGVPSIILSYMEEADYARTLTMQNSKYLTRIMSYQEELEGYTTELFRKLLTFESSLDPSTIEAFEYKLTRPKALNIQNMNDLISNAETTAAFIVRILVGDDADDKIKNKVTSKIVRKVLMSGVYDWDKLDEYVKQAALEIKQEMIETGVTGDNSNNGDDGGGY